MTARPSGGPTPKTRGAAARQGLPERIEDPAAVAVLAAILRDTPALPPPSESTHDERKPAA